MNKNLTLSVDNKIIKQIKSYAKKHHISLSQMVENYFNYLINQSNSEQNNSTLVNELTGIINLPDNFNEKEEYHNFLRKKYK